MIIKDDWITAHIRSNQGIYMSPAFREENAEALARNRLDKQVRILQTDGNPEVESLFAKAFKECLFEDGLRQMGYYWRAKSERSSTEIESLFSRST